MFPAMSKKKKKSHVKKKFAGINRKALFQILHPILAFNTTVESTVYI